MNNVFKAVCLDDNGRWVLCTRRTFASRELADEYQKVTAPDRKPKVIEVTEETDEVLNSLQSYWLQDEPRYELVK
jgi:hypothetical protein